VIGRSRLATVLLLGGAALLSALVVVALAWDREGSNEGIPGAGQPTVPEPAPGQTPPTVAPPSPGENELIGGRGVLLPQIVLFGDTIRARVDLILDNTGVDPTSLRVATVFSPWEIVGEPVRTERSSGTTTYVGWTYTLRCHAPACVPSGQSAPLEFSPARVSYTRPGGPDARTSIRVTWPVLTVYSRFATAGFEGGRAGGPSGAPWRADTFTMPAVTYRFPPAVVVGVAGVLGVLFALGGAALVFLAWPRRAPAPPPEPEPEPVPLLTPLEQALMLLEDAAREDGAEDRRRSLELVAEVLEEHEDARDLALSAKVLAWSEVDPAVEDTSGLAARVRSKLLEEAAESRNGDGDSA
jgi:hypothetical protein